MKGGTWSGIHDVGGYGFCGKSIRWLYFDPDGSLSKSIFRSAGLLKAISFTIHFPGGCFDNLNDSVKDSIGFSLSLMLVVSGG
jgi:hypothetical protein